MAVNINVPSQVKTYANLAAFPATGALKTIYIAEDTNKTYRWTGSVYTEISASAAMTWGAIGGTLSNQTDLQSALDAKVPTSRTLTINGVTQDLSANRTFTISTGITIGSTAIASGTVGRILFEGAGNVVQQSGNLFWDNAANQFIIGGSTASNVRANTNEFNIQRDGLTVPTNGNQLMFNLVGNGQGMSITNQNGTTYRIGQFSVSNVLTLGAAGNNTLNLFTSGNVGIGTTTDAGFRLDVNGTARVSGTLTLNNTSGTNRSTDIRTSNSIDNFPTTTFYPSSGTNVGQSFQVIPRGTGFSAGIKAQFAISGTDTIADGTNFEAMVVRATGSAFTFSSGKGGTGTIRPMLFSAGFLDGVTNPNQLWLYSTGNIGINTTTDAGFRLDVNGTARFTMGTSAEFRLGTSSGLPAMLYTGGSYMMRWKNDASELYVQGTSYMVMRNNTQEFVMQPNSTYLSAGPFAVNTSSIAASAILQANSTTKGFLPPRMTTTEKNAIASPATGLQVYDTTLNQMSYYNGTTWTNI